MATYAENLRFARKPVRDADGTVHLDRSAADAMISALFGMREAFRSAQSVDQIGREMSPAQAEGLYNDLRASLGLPPQAPPPQTERRWTPDHEWAIESIEQMLLMLGLTRDELKDDWPPGRFKYLENFTKAAPA